MDLSSGAGDLTWKALLRVMKFPESSFCTKPERQSAFGIIRKDHIEEKSMT